MNGREVVHQIAAAIHPDARVEERGRLPDGSGFAVVSWPLPKDHWSLVDQEAFSVPPMPLRMGVDHPDRERMTKAVRAAVRYAYRAATMNGKEPDLDPDALVQNAVVGLLGYHTADGLSSDEWSNPTPAPRLREITVVDRLVLEIGAAGLAPSDQLLQAIEDVRNAMDGANARAKADSDYVVLRDVIEEHFQGFIHEDDVAEVAIYADALKEVAARLTKPGTVGHGC